MAEQQKVILRRAQVLALVGMSQSAMYALIADGEFPRPITLSEEVPAVRLLVGLVLRFWLG